MDEQAEYYFTPNITQGTILKKKILQTITEQICQDGSNKAYVTQ